MAVSMKASYTVKPKEPTWEGVMPLSEWDQTGNMNHIPTIHFYKPPLEWLEPSSSIIHTLKESLSRALVYFYPLAGRVRWLSLGRLELLCNSEGVELVVAESKAELNDFFGDFSGWKNRFDGLIPLVDYDKPINELPLMLVQVTVFRCLGVSLAINVSHIVADGHSALYFINEWARLARGKPIQVVPYINYSLLRAHEPLRARIKRLTHHNQDEHLKLNRLPLLIGEEDNSKQRRKPTSVTILILSKEHIKSLKKAANEDLDHGFDKRRPYSRYEAVAAHVWRTACKARAHWLEQPTSLGFCVDVRDRMNPPLPTQYFGNAIIDMVASSTSGQVMSKPLSYTCGKIREAIEKVNDGYAWTNIEYLRSLPDYSPVQDFSARKDDDYGPFYGNPNLVVTSWLNLPIHGLDFGWGREVHTSPGSHDYDGDCLLLPGPMNDGSVKVALCLQVAHMDQFKKYFYGDILCHEH